MRPFGSPMLVALVVAALVHLAAPSPAQAQFGVTVRTRNAGGAVTDRIRVETGVNDAAVRFSNTFLQVDGTALPAVSAAGTGRIVFDGAQFMVSQSGGAFVPMLGGAGANADTLDLLDSLQFLRSDAADNYTSGTMTFDLGTTLNMLGTFQIASQSVNVSDGSAPNAGSNLFHWDNLVGVPAGFADGSDDGAGGGIGSINGETGPAITMAAAGAGLSVGAAGNTVTYTLADLWVNTAGDTMTGALNLPAAGLTIGGQNLGADDLTPPNAGSNLVHWNNLTGVPAGFADGSDDGAGGNADTLDLLDSLQFLRSDAADNYTSGTLTFNLGTTLNVLGTFQLGSQTVNVTDGSAPNVGSNLFHWDNLVGVPAGFADGSDDGAGGGIASVEGQTGPAIDVAAGAGISIATPIANQIEITNTGVTSLNYGAGPLAGAVAMPTDGSATNYVQNQSAVGQAASAWMTGSLRADGGIYVGSAVTPAIEGVPNNRRGNFTSGTNVTTGATTGNAFLVTANSLTTGNAVVLSATGATMTGDVIRGTINSGSSPRLIHFEDNLGAYRFTVDASGVARLGSLAADPAGANGMVYYNTGSNKFRAFENGAWADVIGGAAGVTSFNGMSGAVITTAGAGLTQVTGGGNTTFNIGAGPGITVNADTIQTNLAAGPGVNTAGNLVSWNQLIDVPAGFADGSDDGAGGGITTLNGLSVAVQTFANGSTGAAPNWSSAGAVHTLNIPNASGAGVTGGLLSNADYVTFSGSVDGVLATAPITSTGGQTPTIGINIGVGLGVLGGAIINTGDTDATDDITTATAAGGDLAGTYPSPTVDGLQGNPVSGAVPALNDVLKWNGASWAPATDATGGGVPAPGVAGQILYDNGGAWVALPPGTAGQVLTMVGGLPQWAAPAGGSTWYTISAGTPGGSWGTGTLNPEDPYNVWYHDSRAQFVVLASELTAAGMSAGNITGLRLKAFETPGQDLTDFRIRVQATGATTVTSFVTTGWTLVYGPTTITAASLAPAGWNDYIFSSAFAWDGTSNVLIELTRDNTSFTSAGGMYVQTGLPNRMFAGYADSASAWPFDTLLTTEQQNTIPELQLQAGGGGGGDGGPFEIIAGAVGGTWGSGTLNPEDPFNVWYHDSRAQFVILASELTAAGVTPGNITAIDLKPFEVPGQDLTDFRIRIQATAATTVTSFVTTGWTLNYGPTTIAAASLVPGAWSTFTLSTPFTWNGTSNLLIELTRDNTSFTSAGGMYVQTGLSNRMFAGYADSASAWPFDTLLTTEQQNEIPEIRISQ